MIDVISSIGIGTQLTRLDQRAIDVMLEKKLFKRNVFVGGKLRVMIDDNEKVSFVEQTIFESKREQYKAFEPRVVPFYTRSIESIAHILIPAITDYGFILETVKCSGWGVANIASKSQPDIVVTNCLHEQATLAVSVATLKALYPVDELSTVFEQTKNFIQR